MGEAIARFREAALSIRRLCDERLSEPRWAVVEPAAKTFCSRCRRVMSEFEAGHLGAEAYVKRLRREKWIAEQQPSQDGYGQRQFALVEWLPASMRPPAVPKMKPLAVEAVQEAIGWGAHLSLIESHIRALSVATTRLQEPLEYAANLSRWQEAFDALAPFVNKPPAASGNSTTTKQPGSKQEKRRDRKHGGGRPPKYPMKFIREVVAARERDEKHAAKARRRLPPIPGWLREYCDEHNIDIRERFPPAVPGEAWNIRANRFWRAAKKRLQPAGN